MYGETNESQSKRPTGNGDQGAFIGLVPVSIVPDPMNISQPGDSFTAVVDPNPTDHARPFVPQALPANNTVRDNEHVTAGLQLVTKVHDVIADVKDQQKPNQAVNKTESVFLDGATKQGINRATASQSTQPETHKD